MMIVFLALAYLIGSIPFGLLLTKLFLKEDIRAIGSGNIGATNVLRTGKKGLAFLTLLLDGIKGAIPPLLIGNITATTPELQQQIYDMALIAGLCTILGHCFPVWLKFKGGKGVATAIGVLLAAVPWAGLAVCAVWLAVFFLSRISSASALAALAAAPVVALMVYGPLPTTIVLLIAALVFWRHKDNIKRLLKGEEPKFGKKKEG